MPSLCLDDPLTPWICWIQLLAAVPQAWQLIVNQCLLNYGTDPESSHFKVERVTPTCDYQ